MNRNLDRQVGLGVPVQTAEGHYLLSKRDIKTQYGVQIWWADPKAAGVPEERWESPRIDWFDHLERADSFALNYHQPVDLVDGVLIYDDPPVVKRDVAKVLRYTREAIEVYGPAVEV